MKIAVLSDIHGNVPALTAVLNDIEKWSPDDVYVNGDIVNRGPYSQAVLELLKTNLPNAKYIRGNHETFVLFCRDNPLTPDDEKYQLRQFALWTADQLSEYWLSEIESWGDHYDLSDLEDGCSFHITHGSRLGNRDGIGPATPDDMLDQKLGESRDLFVASHTHKSMIRYYNENLIINTGSVGQPLDDDPRASYGRCSFFNGKWDVEIRRVDFDKETAKKDFYDSGFMENSGPVGQLIYLEHKHNRTFVGPFMRKYLHSVEQREIELDAAVKEYLASNT